MTNRWNSNFAAKPSKPLKRSGFKRKSPKPLKRAKSDSVSKLKRRLDTAFSLHIRQKWANKEGMVKCFTCPKVAHWKQLQNGHYISRSCQKLRWEEDNCRPQCVGCNVFKYGNVITYRENLIKDMSEPAVLLLEAQRWVIFKPTREWYEERLSQLESAV